VAVQICSGPRDFWTGSDKKSCRRVLAHGATGRGLLVATDHIPPARSAGSIAGFPSRPARGATGSVKDGHVNYLGIAGDNRVGAYLSPLDHIDPVSLSTRDEHLAFWINAYNAFAIQGILDGESPAPYIGWYHDFKLRKYGIGVAQLNLFDVEHVILRQQFHEPRAHFAIVCGSVSCPKLQSWAFEGRQLAQQLDQVAREFVNDTSRNRFDRQGKIAYLSKIFDWFEQDFVASTGSVQKFVARYVEDPDVARNLAADSYHLEYLEYDWSLNATPPKKADHARGS
jgi:hypothetical protein